MSKKRVTELPISKSCGAGKHKKKKMSYSYQLVGSIVNKLNKDLQDPYNGTRTGSWVFGPDKQINYKRYMPKIQVLFNGETTEDKSQGNNFKRSKQTTITTYFYTKDGDIGSYSELKNRKLLLYTLDKIEEELKSYRMNNFKLIGIGDVTTPDYSSEHGVHVAGKSFNYIRRET